MTEQRLRWLVLATHVPASGSLGGMVRYCVEIVDALARRRDVELHVLASTSARSFFAARLGADRVSTVPTLPSPALSAVERSGMMPALRDRRFDVIHGTKHLVPRTRAARRVLTVHDMLPFDRPEDHPPIKRLLLRRHYLASLRDADVCVCVSDATRRRLVARVPEVADRCAVVPLTSSSQLLASTSRPVDGLGDDVPFALVVGDPSPRKNLPFVVSWWRRVRAMTPGAVLVVVGPTGWGVDAYGAGFDALVREGAVRVLGHVSDPQLRWCYERARVVLCPSLVEGFGLPAAEAVAFGAPLVTSTDEALVEASGAAGTHLPPDDAPAWIEAVTHALGRARGNDVGQVVRTWDDVADETVRAVRATSMERS